MSYVAKREQPVWRQARVRSTTRPSPPSSMSWRISAAGSLAEGLDTLTLHRLGVYGVLGRSLKTTNGTTLEPCHPAATKPVDCVGS